VISRSQVPVRSHARGIAVLGALVIAAAACADVSVAPGHAAAVALDSVMAPSVVAGDSLRDTLGIARPMYGTAYDGSGHIITGFPLRFRALDSGIVIDSTTGYIVGDTARSTPIRLLIDAVGLQTPIVQLYVVPRPDTLSAVTGDTSITYSVTDTSAVFSPELQVLLQHDSAGTLSPVQAYVVSYAITYPADTTVAQLVNRSGRTSFVDTTGSNGVAGRSIRIRPLHLSATTDSVVVLASAKYRGALVAGSPIRLVLHVAPNQ